MSATATTLSTWVKAIKRALDAAGCDSAALMREAGMDLHLLDDVNARYPLTQTTRLWQLALRETGDPCIGLKVASQVNQTTFHTLGYTVAASVTLKDAFERIVRYFRIVTDAAELQFTLQGGEYHFVIHTADSGPRPAPEAIDAFVSTYVRMCRALGGRDISPLRIELQRPAPPDRGCFDSILRAPLAFGASRNLLVYDKAMLERRLEGANPDLVRHHDDIALKYLAQFDKSNIRARVKAALLKRLGLGEPSQDQIAHALHTSTRSLQRRLADEGTSYKEVLDTTRRELALSYLRSRQHTVSEVTYLLGFSDTSSFTRAFKRWTGCAPSAFRLANGTKRT